MEHVSVNKVNYIPNYIYLFNSNDKIGQEYIISYSQWLHNIRNCTSWQSKLHICRSLRKVYIEVLRKELGISENKDTGKDS